jgi:RimJ/RimL family protein N-acetyltransferase
MWADPRVTRHIGGRPSTEEEAWARVLRYAGLWALVGFGYWVVRERATGRFVGEVGLADFRRELAPPLDPPLAGAPEVGWVLAPWAHGRGFATEAVRAALAWADGRAADPRLASGRAVCLIAPENAASVRVAERCGFRPAGRAAYKGEATLLFERAGA